MSYSWPGTLEDQQRAYHWAVSIWYRRTYSAYTPATAAHKARDDTNNRMISLNQFTTVSPVSATGKLMTYYLAR